MRGIRSKGLMGSLIMNSKQILVQKESVVRNDGESDIVGRPYGITLAALPWNATSTGAIT